MENFLKQIRDNWILLAFLVAMILWYGRVDSRLTILEAAGKDQADLLTKISQIQVDVAFIKGQIKNKLK